MRHNKNASSPRLREKSKLYCTPSQWPHPVAWEGNGIF